LTDSTGAAPVSAPPRAEPRQQRSRDTVASILAAADIEIAERGSAMATTTAIAERAGVSVGALYRFFPDKHAIGDALAERYRAAAIERFAPILVATETLDDVPAMIGSVVRVAAELQLDHRGYYRLTQEVRPDVPGSPGQAVRRAMVDAFDERLVALGAHAPTERRRIALELAIETVRHTLVMCPPDGVEREAMLAELEVMVVTYAVNRLGLADPADEKFGD